ncbi:hypothetical protein IJG72_05345 [bacterium]|nr:hypothetical protein [bacterium]
MKKLILFFLIISLLASGFTHTKKFKYGIIFNDEPFTLENAQTYKRSFKRNERIYWLFMSKKSLTKVPYIKIQVAQTNSKGPIRAITGISYTHEYRTNPNTPHYFTDYVVMHSAGHYYMEVFDKNNLLRPLVVADFFVK